MAKKSRAEPSPVMAADKPYRERSSASVTLGDNIKLPRLHVGGKVTVQLTGKLTRISDESYGKGFSMDITSIDTDGGMAGDLRKAKRARTLMDDFED